MYYRLPVNNHKREGRPEHGAALIDGESVSSLHFLQYNFNTPKTDIADIPDTLKNIFLRSLRNIS